jgi:hypothetical protein
MSLKNIMCVTQTQLCVSHRHNIMCVTQTQYYVCHTDTILCVSHRHNYVCHTDTIMCVTQTQSSSLCCFTLGGEKVTNRLSQYTLNFA